MNKLLNITLIIVFVFGSLSLENLKSQEQDTSNFSAPRFEDDQEFESGADTFEAQAGESGNWYEKRVLLKKAGPKRSKIKLKIQDLEKLATALVEKRNAQEKEYKAFVSELGFELTKIDQEIENFSKEIDSFKEKSTLTDQEKKYLEEIEKNKTDLIELKSELDLINQIDQAVFGAMHKLDEQTKTAKNYEERSIKLYDAISDVLDDKKAKSYYMQMEALLDNVEAIERYLNTQFSSYIDISTNTIKERAQKIKESIKSLEDRGVILNTKLLEQQKAEKEKLAQEKAAQKKKVESKSIWSEFADFISQILNWLAWPFIKIYQLIFGK